MKKISKEDYNKKYNKLTKQQKIDVLWDALSYMQQYNGRTHDDCVAMAMGFYLED